MLTSLKWAHEMTVSSDCMCLRVVFVSGIPRNSRRDWSIHFDFFALPINSRFICWRCWFVFVSLCQMTTKDKFTFYVKDNGSWTWKAWRWAGWGCPTVTFEKSVRWVNLQNFKSLLVIVWMISVVQSFNIIVWPRPFLKWPNLKCHVGHMTHFD